MRASPHHVALAKLLKKATSGRHHLWDVFRDWIECTALAFSNSVDLAQREAREARYMEIVGRYDPKIVVLFPKMLGELTMALEVEPHDALGMLFEQEELASSALGQFFTPFDVSLLMAQLQLSDGRLGEAIEERGFVTVNEPAAGAGGMVIAFALAMQQAGFNPQTQMHATLVDVDQRSVHMAYVQLALLGIPAIVVHGNSLTLETHSQWFTPAHVMGLWNYRLQRRDETPDTEPAPVVTLGSSSEQPALFEVAS